MSTQQMKKDAERYRFLRKMVDETFCSGLEVVRIGDDGEPIPLKVTLDEAIDAEMEKMEAFA